MSKELIKTKPGKFLPWKKVISSSVIKFRESADGPFVVSDSLGRPRAFAFDTNAFLDLLSHIDEALVDKLSTSEYHSKKVNPAGWLIDEIETKLPMDQDELTELKNSIKEADEEGWIPFSKIKQEFNLA